MLGVSDFTAGVVAALIGGVIAGGFAITAGVIAARVEARRTGEVAVQLRRREREEEAMWELTHRLSQIRDEFRATGGLGMLAPDAPPGALLAELDERWRTHLAAGIRSGPIAQGYAEIQRLAAQAWGGDRTRLLTAIDGLLDELHIETGRQS